MQLEAAASGGAASSSSQPPAALLSAAAGSAGPPLPLAETSQASAAAQESGDMDDIDALCELIDASGAGGQAFKPPAEVDELLGALAAGGASSPLLAARLSPRLSPRTSPLGGPQSLHSLGSGDLLEPDLPEPVMALPPEVKPIPFTMVAKFHLRCEVDLKQVAFGLKHAEYNPRKHSSITVRLLDPRTVALVRASGSVSITGTTDPQDLKNAAKKITRLLQRAGAVEAKFTGYKVTSLLCKATLGFPVRLDHLAAKWRKNALYEPELYSGCVFRTRRPRATYLITVGGKVMISGCRTIAETQEALRRVYPILFDFRH